MKKPNYNLQIFSIEGKDVLTKYYTLNNSSNRKGSFDDSIEIDAINDMFPQFTKRNTKTDRLYTNDIITITFEYSCHKDRDLTDEEYERLESLRLTQSLLTDKSQINDTKRLIKLAERDITKKEIRSQLYKYGFNIRINGKCIHFVRYKRTSGSARVGKCLFINEKYAKKMIDWSFAGIPHEEGQKMDCASMEAYISLPTSSSIDRFKLKPENILLIDDCYSKFEDTVMATKLVNKEYNEDGNVVHGDLFTDIETTTIDNNIFDGESLLDKSVFVENGYGDKATLQVRNRFFKGICVNTDIQKFFKDNGITRVDQLNGKTIATDISQIKLITTPSSVKYLKFDTFEKWLIHLVEDWGICKYEKPQHHFNGMAQTHYQLLNTLGMNKDEMRLFLKDSIDYAWLLKKDIGVFKYHIGLNKADDEEDIIIEERLRNSVNTTSDFVLNMLAINDDFQYSKIFKDYRKEVIKSYTNNLRKGHVLVNGNYSVMVSCPYEFLLASIGKFDGTSKTLGNYECYSNKFDDNQEILGVRSPQPTMANIVLFTNNKCEILDRYFNTNSKEVIYVSPIGNNLLSILSGADFDGDTVMVTDNKHLVEAYKKNISEYIEVDNNIIKRFLVSTDFTPKSGIKRKYTPEDLCDVDIKCSQNKIGEIINLAQMLNSLYWDWKYKGVEEHALLELYKDISALNILSCIEIDRCKKLSPVDAKKELNKIRDKYDLGKGTITRDKVKKEVNVRPYFFKFLDGGKDYKFDKFNTGMDYLEEIVDETIKRNLNYNRTIKLIDLIENSPSSKASRKTVDKVKKYYLEMRDRINYIYYMNYDNKYEMVLEVKQEILDRLNKLKINSDVIYTILKRMAMYELGDKRYNEYRGYGLRCLTLLYDYNKRMFFSCFKVKSKKNEYIVPCKDGEVADLTIHGVGFKRVMK